MRTSVYACAIIGVILFLPFSVEGGSETKKQEAFRAILIPAEEHGYSNFESTVIRSRNELASFLKNVSGSGTMGWNNRKGFVGGIGKASVDFEHEVLVLVRHTEGSGSVGVAFKTPLIKLKALICQIERAELGDAAGTADMAYYCFALAVSKSVIQEVVLEIVGREPVVLPLVEKK